MVLSEKLRRSATLSLAALLFLASLVPLLTRQKADAYELMTERYIQMSSSADGSLTDGQGVTYEVGFRVADGALDVAGVVVEFCGNSPIIGDTCTAPVGFDVSAATLTLGTGLAGFTKDAGTTTASKFVLTGTAVTTTTGDNIDFELIDVDNPETVNTSFYARILTFATAVGAQEYESADIDDADDNTGVGGNGPHVVIDAAGVALSTTQQITITSKVQERITFCVYTQVAYVPTTDNTCAGKTYVPISLGDENGVLSDSGPFVDKTAYYSITTNAAFDAAIRLKGGTLVNGTEDIDAIPTTTVEGSDAGEEQFGLCTYQIDGAGLTPAPTYDGAQAFTIPAAATGAGCAATTQTAGTGSTGGDGAASFAFDTDPTNGTMSTYGMTIGTKQPGDYSTGNLAFLGNISPVTQPGIYTTTLTFIATGTY